jgi:hypothetical protein
VSVEVSSNVICEVGQRKQRYKFGGSSQDGYRVRKKEERVVWVQQIYELVITKSWYTPFAVPEKKGGVIGSESSRLSIFREIRPPRLLQDP